MIGSLLRRIVPERFRPIGYLTHLVRQRTNSTVRSGPFEGMRYVENSIGSAYLPKLLGTYERELVRIIEAVCRRSPGLIIDLGAAEGYYAVGLALRSPNARVVAFEFEEAGRCALRKMAQMNDVQDRIEIQGECEPAQLHAVLSGNHDKNQESSDPMPFILCDIEGDEDRLLAPASVTALSRAQILVETHEFVCPGITEKLQQRFASTHSIECIWQTARMRADFPFCSPMAWVLPKRYLTWAVSEWRPERMCWLWMQPHE